MHPGPSFSGSLGPILRILGDTLPAALAAVVYLVARRLCGSSLAGRGLCSPRFRPSCRMLRLGGRRVRPFVARRNDLALLLPNGAAALRVRRPQLRLAQHAAAADCRVAHAPDRGFSCLRLSLFLRVAVPADALAADADRRGADHRSVQAGPGPLCRTGHTALNVLRYVPGKTLDVTPDELAAVAACATNSVRAKKRSMWDHHGPIAAVAGETRRGRTGGPV